MAGERQIERLNSHLSLATRLKPTNHADMKANRLASTLLILLVTVARLVGQEGEATRKWFEEVKVKAEKGDAAFQEKLATLYLRGWGVDKDAAKAVRWLRKAAEQGRTSSQSELGMWLWQGRFVSQESKIEKNPAEAIVWFHRAAAKGNAEAILSLGAMYMEGEGVRQNFVEAYKWFAIAAAFPEKAESDFLEPWSGGILETKTSSIPEMASKARDKLALHMSAVQIAEAQRLVREFKLPKAPESGGTSSGKAIADSNPTASGTGFFITADGFLISNAHVVEGAAQVRLVTSAGLISAKVVKVDAANDLALLKAEGKFASLPVSPSRPVKLGATVLTVGFPNIGLQGFAPKLAKGEIASLSGAGDDARYFQISVPVQPGNSGGALVDERGNVVGVVSAKLNASAALRSSGALPENVNYAVKSSYLLSFLESVPEVAAKLQEPNTKEKKFEDVVKEAEQAAVLVLVY